MNTLTRNTLRPALLSCLTAAALLTGCSSQDSHPVATTNKTVPAFWPEITPAVKQDPVMEQSINELLAKMTLEQKIGQMIQPEIRDFTVEDMRRYGFGSYLNGGGSFPQNNKQATPADWIKLAEAMYQASIDDSLDGSTIPTMWGTDAVHGHNNVIGATLFPHNIGLGATNNPQLIEKIASITAKEVMVTGIDWVFAPTVAVVRDDRWGRTYEGYSEDPDIVKAYAAAIVKGLQGSADEDFLGDKRVISTVKHFIGDGGTENGDDQGNTLAGEQQLFDLHAQGYVGGLSVGAQTVMASFNSWQGIKNHGNKYLLTDVLKTRMGFDGLVVGDWNGHGQIAGCTNESCPQAANAGLDIYMAPTPSWKPLMVNTIAQVKSGEISQQRVDDAVRRILRVKMRAGLFTKPSPANRALSGKTQWIGAKAHRDVARQAVRESLVLLKNKAKILPLMPNQRVLVAGGGADNIGQQAGGWTVTWQGTGNKNSDFPGAVSIYGGIKQTVTQAGGTAVLSVDGSYSQKPDVAIVVFGEQPYAEGNGDLDNLEYQRGNKQDLALLKKLKAKGIPVVSIFISGRPLWVNPEINASDAFVAAWLPGTQGDGISEVIFRQANGKVNAPFTGKLSFSWPSSPTQTAVNRHDTDETPLLAYGYGLSYGDNQQGLNDGLTENVERTSAVLETLVLFQGSVKQPWKMYVGADDKRQAMTSSVEQNKNLAVRTIDKVVQEDARQLVFNGKGNGSLSLGANFPQDLRGYLDAKASLSFIVKVNEPPAKPVMLNMNSQQHNESAVDLTAKLTALAQNNWHNVSVDLQCFKDKGVDIGQIFSPFSLSTDGQFSVSIADITVVPDSAQSATISCQ